MWERCEERFREPSRHAGRESRDVLPGGLATMLPGPGLARHLEGLDRGELNGYELVELIEARSHQLAYIHAELYADIAELAHSAPCHADDPPRRSDEVDELIPDDVRAALVLTRRAADHLVALALGLRERLPRVWEALQRGAIDVARARVLLERTDHLDETAARAVIEEILDRAGDLTTGQLKRRLDKLCVETDPDDAKDRYQKAVEERHVEIGREPDGTASLFARGLPPERIKAIMDQITRLAQKLKTKDEPRTLEQLRVDLFLALLEGRHHGDSRHRPMVDIRVDLPTLVGLADKAGEIPGWGPVIADIARQAVEHNEKGEWRAVVTDPDTGAVLWDGLTKRRPTPAQRRHVEARQATCSFRGCSYPARDGDIDHSIEYARGGRTEVASLGPACRHDHRLRHEGGWTFTQPTPGVHVWTSPRGHTYVTGSSPPP